MLDTNITGVNRDVVVIDDEDDIDDEKDGADMVPPKIDDIGGQ